MRAVSVGVGVRAFSVGMMAWALRASESLGPVARLVAAALAAGALFAIVEWTIRRFPRPAGDAAGGGADLAR